MGRPFSGAALEPCGIDQRTPIYATRAIAARGPDDDTAFVNDVDVPQPSIRAISVNYLHAFEFVFHVLPF